ncbi:unnamed protein product [Dicrocoelium dendriticum]|nr:unnamed protein product [Dicrocoelium dendriticum]
MKDIFRLQCVCLILQGLLIGQQGARVQSKPWHASIDTTRQEYCRAIWWKFVRQCPANVPIQNEEFIKKIPWRPDGTHAA